MQLTNSLLLGNPDLNIAITATSGKIACDLNGCTLELFLGIRDVTLHGSKLINHILENEEAINRIRKTDFLILGVTPLQWTAAAVVFNH